MKSKKVSVILIKVASISQHEILFQIDENSEEFQKMLEIALGSDNARLHKIAETVYLFRTPPKEFKKISQLIR